MKRLTGLLLIVRRSLRQHALSTAITVMSVALASGLSACGSGSAMVGGGSPVVVATTTQVGDFARAVAGRRAGVRQILSANSDPHAYEPRPSDVRAVTGAKVVVRSGGDLDDRTELGDVGQFARRAGLEEPGPAQCFDDRALCRHSFSPNLSETGPAPSGQRRPRGLTGSDVAVTGRRPSSTMRTYRSRRTNWGSPASAVAWATPDNSMATSAGPISPAGAATPPRRWRRSSTTRCTGRSSRSPTEPRSGRRMGPGRRAGGRSPTIGAPRSAISAG